MDSVAFIDLMTFTCKTRRNENRRKTKRQRKKKRQGNQFCMAFTGFGTLPNAEKAITMVIDRF